MSSSEPRRKSTLREYLEALLIAVIFVNFARIFVFQAFKIPTGSMVDNLLIGDHIIVNKYVYGAHGFEAFGPMFAFREIGRGDIVVFRFPAEPATDFVKRVVALPGEMVRIRNKEVYVNGRRLEEPYKLHSDPRIFTRRERLEEPFRSRDQFGPLLVPEGTYFVMGDNRDRSNDSRFWGTVPRSMIKGKALLVYWSFRGQPLLPGSSSRERLGELRRVVTNFLSDTRWDRTFFIIDSKYHYRPEADSAGSRP